MGRFYVVLVLRSLSLDCDELKEQFAMVVLPGHLFMLIFVFGRGMVMGSCCPGRCFRMRSHVSPSKGSVSIPRPLHMCSHIPPNKGAAGNPRPLHLLSHVSPSKGFVWRSETFASVFTCFPEQGFRRLSQTFASFKVGVLPDERTTGCRA